MKRFLLFLACLTIPARADEITVSAAASLREVLTEIGANYRKAQPQTRLNFNFGSSGTLQKQIEAGAPVDVFIAAASKNIAALASQGAIDGATQRLFAGGELVLIAPRESKLRSLSDLKLPSVRTLALGGPGVPAGDYARQTLRFLKLSDAVAPKIVNGKDVRAVLAQVAAGNADAGFVYRTDALSSRAVRVVAVAPAQSHAPVRYPMAVVKEAPNRAGALRFWRYLSSSSAKKVLQRRGFRPG
ncbi:MAG TPA: molybdate ABC transporter substrate-binding protein [Abditibacterium sp.]|jgi:molybdate transport system substrate-binding protein